MIRRFALASALLIAAGSAAPAMAGTATANLTVSSNVVNKCNISASPIDFGDYDPIVANSGPSEDLDGTGTVTVTCTSGAPVTITLGQGNNPGSGSTDASPMRRLNNGANYLSYGIYQNIQRTAVLG
ncbi:MAG: spore coat protein U domain-containing protein, partial [Dolichospermum sp.]